ncbi:DNA methyltransferase [Nonomuraea sp. NPDC050310]|uniref:DNA-methyltransferase n=1 Tax=Nonomuraea sp. NPDC050310 TaxID=3154935 RepID=UPI0033D5EFE5
MSASSLAQPYYADDMVTVHLGDCLDVLRGMPDASVDAVVTDPPAGISFMGKTWDADKGGRAVWVAWLTEVMTEVRRVLKPGGHALVWALPRTSHWTATALEDAGLEIRDCIVHIFGSGFPKSLDVSKAIHAHQTVGGSSRTLNRRAALGDQYVASPTCGTSGVMASTTTATTAGGTAVSADEPTDDAARWEGWGTALKPGQEHWWLIRKPLAGTVAQTVLEYGTGALHIAACRVEPTGESRPRMAEASQDRRYTERGGTDFAPLPGVRGGAPEGRWPTNLVFSHSASCVENGPCDQETCPVAELDRQSGWMPSNNSRNKGRGMGYHGAEGERGAWAGDAGGGASRFFPVFRYEAKAGSAERPKLADGTAHATVKPLALMRWLVKLVTPPGGTVLDPFAGSGTTAEACVLEGFRSVLIEQDPAHCELIKTRLSKPLQPSLEGLFGLAGEER